MRPVLQVKNRSRTFTVDVVKDELTFGRNPKAAEVATHDVMMSRRHFAVRKKGEAFYVVDLQSKNGTFVNGQLIVECPIKLGDVIRAGETLITFSGKKDDPPPPKKELPPPQVEEPKTETPAPGAAADAVQTEQAPAKEGAAGWSAGFRALVEPILLSVSRNETGLNFFGRLKAKWKLKSLIGRINDGLLSQNVSPNGWDKVSGDTQCRLRVAKLGLLQELREYAQRTFSGSEPSKFPHFMQHRDWHSYYIPVDFPRPFSVRGEGKGQVIPIGSSLRLQKELAEVNKILKLDRGMDANKMVAYLDVSERDIFKYETTSEYMPDFWLRFGFVILKKLCDASVQHKMPIIFL